MVVPRWQMLSHVKLHKFIQRIPVEYWLTAKSLVAGPRINPGSNTTGQITEAFWVLVCFIKQI